MTVPPRAPLSSRFGALGALAKRIVERLIRFYIVRQDEVNRQVDARLRDLEAAPVEHRAGDYDLRAQYAALSARLTFVQREIAPLRRAVAALTATQDGAAQDGTQAGDVRSRLARAEQQLADLRASVEQIRTSTEKSDAGATR